MITTNNPFEVIDQRLSNIESLLIDIKNKSENVNIEKKELSEHIRIKECSEITGLAEATIRTLAHFGKIPYYKQGKFLAFNCSEILEWLQSGRKTIAEKIAVE